MFMTMLKNVKAAGGDGLTELLECLCNCSNMLWRLKIGRKMNAKIKRTFV